ncbi:hypothetical protein FK529_05640 [Tsukamurella asaccharolytica]|uniref:Uncharacterized protein n=1 Tax=Tsukamurella asaccharolytica TaxID=2592067 RepID=A0A5C5RFD9_9ACTN|nr:hypothetical protein [Tsukamurella asaccharolytica]TWS20805.1 hypothetical protein FK529_05640 [Tsukamurella asaccharolytica]
MTAPVGTVALIDRDEARTLAEWLIAEQRWLGQRTANAVADAWLADVAQLEDRARWLLAESEHHHQVTAKKAASAVVDARVARASLETIRARVSHAARVGLLTHRGEWPAEVLDAAASAMSVPVRFGAGDDPARKVAEHVLDAAARALHRDHVHVAPHSAAHTVDIVDKSGLSADLDTWLAKNRAAQTKPEVF